MTSDPESRRYLLYLVALGEPYRRFAMMTITSIRRLGEWPHEIILLSDTDAALPGFPDVRVINVLTGAQARYPWLKMDKRSLVHFKTELEYHVDISAYDYILYLDCDLLVTTSRLPGLVAACCRERVIVVQQDMIAISSGTRFAGGGTLSKQEQQQWGNFAINAGIVGLPTTPMGRRLFRDWRALNIEQRFRISDQGALLSLLLRQYYGQWGYVTDAVIGRTLNRYSQTFVHFTSHKDILMADYFTQTLGLTLPG